MMTNHRKTCILVLGMHRTGTSATTGILNILGINLGKRLIQPQPENQKGFFENKDIVDLNISFLESFGVDRDAIFNRLANHWIFEERTQKFKENLKKIISQEFSETSIFAIKDPRISILLPVYIEVFKELDIDLFFVVCRRGVQNVALSLKKRNGIDFVDSLNAYKYYYKNINAFLYKYDYLNVDFDSLVNNPTEFSKYILDKFSGFNLNHSDETGQLIKKFIDSGLKNNNISYEDFSLDILNQKNFLEKEFDNLKAIRSKDLEVLNEKSEHLVLKENENRELRGIISVYKKKLETNNEIVSAHEDSVSLYKDRAHKQYLQSKYLQSLLKERDEHIVRLNSKIVDIERSFVWKVVKGWDFFLSLLFPKGSVVRNFYEKLLNINQRFINEVLPNYAVIFLKKRQSNLLKKSEYTTENFWKKFKDKNKDIDVLFINHDESRTGAPRIVFDVAEYVKKNKKVAMVSLTRGSMTKDFNDEFGDVIYPDELYKNVSILEQARNIIKEVNPKLVYANSIGSHPFAIAAKELNIPVIFHVHELDIAIDMMFRGKKRQEFKNFADIFIAVSIPVQNILIKRLGCAPDKVVLINAFVDKDKILRNSLEVESDFIISELDKKEKEIIIMTVGHFIYRKGADIFMKIAKKIKEKGHNVKFVWIGDKPFKEPFMSDFGYYSPYFKLVQEKINPFPYIKQADIFILPSREDPFPLVILESMTLSKPTIVFKEAGGIHEAIKDSGIIIEKFDEEKFSDAIEELILDETKRQELGEKATQYQEQYDSKFALPKIENIINQHLLK